MEHKINTKLITNAEKEEISVFVRHVRQNTRHKKLSQYRIKFSSVALSS